ncbi:hypothetical protein AAFF_G00290360 [Aldrovandia affinis]|uniref:Uncharacterized protein n=1 Tax=Aldrovandia affinis TaxID=143900 RepID=A0AAD7W1E8_9TELE|nr:hypothetical protein AAFF_G00290360 [Aldrovandia affinis]
MSDGINFVSWGLGVAGPNEPKTLIRHFRKGPAGIRVASGMRGIYTPHTYTLRASLVPGDALRFAITTGISPAWLILQPSRLYWDQSNIAQEDEGQLRNFSLMSDHCCVSGLPKHQQLLFYNA